MGSAGMFVLLGCFSFAFADAAAFNASIAGSFSATLPLPWPLENNLNKLNMMVVQDDVEVQNKVACCVLRVAYYRQIILVSDTYYTLNTPLKAAAASSPD